MRGGRERETEKQERERHRMRASLFRGGGEWSDAESCRELGESEQTYRSFHGHAPMGLFLQHLSAFVSLSCSLDTKRFAS